MAEGLVGRRWELRALVDLLYAARSGRGRGCGLLLGEAGIDKTTLALAAGFGTVDVAPIPHPFWKFYRLNP
jgi:predicted ribonuclease YlaK